MSHIFDRCGLASRSDLRSADWASLYGSVKREQEMFLAHESEFRSREYPWPSDSLHWWSRVWEYPYVFHQLATRLVPMTRQRRATVVDFGSGVTFFPFAAAKLGLDIVCVDVNPVCTRDIERAAAVVSQGSGRVSALRSERGEIAMGDGSVDALYCISVLEHVDDIAFVLGEIARVVVPGGLVVLTFDVDLRGDFQLGVSERKSLHEMLKQNFEAVVPTETVHPAELLTSRGGEYPLRWPRGAELVSHLLNAWVRPSLRGRRRSPLGPYLLAVEAVTLVRR